MTVHSALIAHQYRYVSPPARVGLGPDHLCEIGRHESHSSPNMAVRRRASICSARPSSIDTTALDEAKAAELNDLVAAAISAPPRAPDAGKGRDEMSYTITIQDDGRETVLSQSDTTMSAEFGKLIGWLRRYPKA